VIRTSLDALDLAHADTVIAASEAVVSELGAASDACAVLLINEGYTSVDHLAGQGNSAGGITVGGAIAQRLGLLAAALLRVITDALRFETTALGPQNAREFGSSAVPAEFKPLYNMSAYYHVVDKTCNPEVLLTGQRMMHVSPGGSRRRWRRVCRRRLRATNRSCFG
jgi:prolyl oligopeptidase PreP (S9A serine peptidase family)